MSKHKKMGIWIIWLSLLLITSGYYAYTLVSGKDKTVFMPGELTDGHHQIAEDCQACHGSSFTDKEIMQENCVACHGDQRKKPFDSHPRAKFTDPRNADTLENINALYCVTCHVEHQPHITQKTGVTQPKDFCIHCHSDIANERPSHEGMEFNTCANSGCHNFHNNRSLYTDYLIKHSNDPELLDKKQVPEREFLNVLDEIVTYPRNRFPIKELNLENADVDKGIVGKGFESALHNWDKTSHAKVGANCTACHTNTDDDKWIDKPNEKQCAQCHDIEVKHFLEGKHGMRLRQGLSPMTPEQARLPMHETAADKELGCNSCHTAHKDDVKTAAVDACLECHNDDHSNAYKDSSHYALWEKELSGDLPKGSGVSCATCHMPRVALDVNDWLRRTVVQHNQNATLTPNEKMIRPACIQCHGLEFSINALADKALIKNNFSEKPSVHINSMDMAREEQNRHEKKSGSTR